MTELLFAKKIEKKDCQQMLSDNNIPFDPKASVAVLRDLLVANELALAVDPEAVEEAGGKLTIIAEKYHNCEMAGQAIKFAPGDELELDSWKAEAIVQFGVARYK